MVEPKTARPKTTVARKLKEIILEIEESAGTLAELLGYLAEHEINLLGYSALRMHDVGVLHLIPDNPARAMKLLGKTPATRISVSDIVYAVTRDKVGGGAALAGIIAAAGINIHYSYATSSTGARYGVIYQTSDNAKAVRLLNK